MAHIRALVAALLLTFVFVPTAYAPPAKPRPIITFGTPAPSFPDTTPAHTRLSTVTVSMSDGSSYGQTVSLSGTGGGACELEGSTSPTYLRNATTLTAGNYTCIVHAIKQGVAADSSITVTITTQGLPTPSISLGTPSPSIYTSKPVGSPLSTIAVATSNGSAFTGTLDLSHAPNGNGNGLCAISGAYPNATVVLNQIAAVGFSCTVAATQNGVTSTADLTVSVTAAIPTVVLSTPTKTIQVSASPGTLLSGMAVTMSDASVFSGSFSFGGTYGNDTANGGGFCQISGTNPNASITLAKAPTVGTHRCSVVATENGQSSSAVDLTVTVSAPATPTAAVNPASKTISVTTPINTPLSAVSVTMSDGSGFSGSLGLTGTYGNGGGICALSGVYPSVNITLAAMKPAQTYRCSVVATQGTISGPSADLTITVSAVSPVVSLNPTSLFLPNSAGIGTQISTISVTMSDGSSFTGTLGFGGTYGSGNGVCALPGSGTVLTPPTSSTFVDVYGTWGFGALQPNGDYLTLLNGSNANGGAAILLLLYNGTTYAKNVSGLWYKYTAGWTGVGADPRAGAGNSLTTGISLLALGGTTQHCSVVATQGGQASSPADMAIAVTGSTPSPIVSLTPSSTSIWTSAQVGRALSAIGVTMSDSSTFTGTRAITNDAGGVCQISGNNVVLARTVSANTYNCTVVATQGSQSGSAVLTVIASEPTLSLVFVPPHPAVLDTINVGTQLSTVTVSVADGSLFHGTLDLTHGSYTNGGGACVLSGGTGTLITAPTSATLTNVYGTWSFDNTTPISGRPGEYYILINGSNANGGVAVSLLLYNGEIYGLPLNSGWYHYTGSWAQSPDPRQGAGGNILVTGKTLTAGVVYNCTVTAVQ